METKTGEHSTCNAETIELYHFLLPALDMRWSLRKGHYLDEGGGLRQILLQHTKREELLCLELEDKSFMGMHFSKATVQIWHVPGNNGEQVPSQLATSFINSDSRLISVVRRPHRVLSFDQLGKLHCVLSFDQKIPKKTGWLNHGIT